MISSKLQEEIRAKIQGQGFRLSHTDYQKLYDFLLNSIIENLNKGDIIDISNFGSLWMKKGEVSSTTFFKPSDGILERVNTQK